MQPQEQGGYPPLQGGYQQGAPPQGYPQPQGGAPQGYPQPQGGAPQGYPQPQGGAPQGYPQPQGGAPQGYPQPQGGAPQGYPQPQGGAPQGSAPQGSAPQGYPQPQGGGANEGQAAQPPAAATAPPMDKMDTIAGYGDFGAPLAPPIYEQSTMEPPQRSELPNMPTVTVEQAREALLGHVAENCCYGKKAAEEMVFNDIQHSSAFHYKLETFTEKRTTGWASEPYRNQLVDGPSNGPAPGPWDLTCNPPAKFKNHKAEVEVPHTASVKPCHDCVGIGRSRCHSCHGDGNIRCHHCHGTGHVHDPHHHDDHHQGNHGHHGHHGHHGQMECTWCHGTGHQRCHKCHGHGQVTCGSCAGAGNLKVFIKLIIEWINHLSDSIVERTSLPDELIRGVTGEVAFSEEQLRVWPINHFPDPTINQASNQLVKQHTTGFPLERIISQRHNVRIIPVAQALYKWKTTQGSFYVYGFEHKVYAPDYPQQCCCGCTIL